jgi:hypothetical protein
MKRLLGALKRLRKTVCKGRDDSLFIGFGLHGWRLMVSAYADGAYGGDGVMNSTAMVDRLALRFSFLVRVASCFGFGVVGFGTSVCIWDMDSIW